ncbi:hypothetical protein HDU85_004473 [Gaertneriomyces sp. JEL0708]|nr:hypothetical protein HDU85_004473 [Gaertneriomyces sp. JEL0708]
MPAVPLPPPAARLAAVQTLRSRILRPALKPSPAQPVAQKLLTHYPPDINVHKLAKQDTSLTNLQLKDVWMETRLEREGALRLKGKVVRVSVRGGMQKPPEAPAAGKKGKKRK